MSLPFDATLKDIVANHPADFAGVFGLPAYEPATSLNVDLSTISAATDVALGYGKPLREIVDLNFQSSFDARLPARLHSYNALLHARYAVPVRSDVILLRPKADAANLTGKLTYGDGEHRVEFGYSVIRLWLEPVEHYLNAGAAALPLATLCQMPPGQPLAEALSSVVQEIDLRLGKEATPAESMRLMTAAYILTGLRVKTNERPTIFKGVRIMHEMTAYDELVEEGRKARADMLLRLGQRLFGPPSAETKAELDSIDDIERLNRFADAILSAKSWDELLATP